MYSKGEIPMSSPVYRYINVVEEHVHGRELTMEVVKRHTENFSKPAVFRNMVDIDPKLSGATYC
jgi:hypothetical protein